VVKEMLRRGFILLPAGERGNVIAITPAFTITEKQLEQTLRALQSSFANLQS
jgi:4-aminobutyrate aminotransferase-like enzyme